jgi:hypothetical protein
VLSTIPQDRICVTPRAVLGFHAARWIDQQGSMPAVAILVALFVKESGAIAAAHIVHREPFKTLMAIPRTMFFVFFVDPWRFDAEMCHDPSPKCQS